MSGPRVYDGHQWTPVVDDSGAHPVPPVMDGDGTIFVSIVSYRGMYNGTISSVILSMFSFHIRCFHSRDCGLCFIACLHDIDGERCGKTLKSLFENAANPDKVVVGLVEQNAPEDKFCLEAYCELFGASFGRGHTPYTLIHPTRHIYTSGDTTGAHPIKREQIRADTTKVIRKVEGRLACPRYDQVRLVAYHHIQAKVRILLLLMSHTYTTNQAKRPHT
jgi:Glycosyltransferase (GlcNAc)